MERDFFGIKGADLNKFGLIDKINLHYKVGDHIGLTFNDEESVFLNRIDKANTWKEVVEISKDLYDYAKENESETDMSDHYWEDAMMDDEDGEEGKGSGTEGGEEGEEDYEFEDSDSDNFDDEEVDEEGKRSGTEGDEDGEEDKSVEEGNGSGTEGGVDGEFDPESKTDRNFRNNESELISDEAKPYRYINLPNNVDLNTIIIPFSEIYEEYRKIYSKESVLE